MFTDECAWMRRVQARDTGIIAGGGTILWKPYYRRHELVTKP